MPTCADEGDATADAEDAAAGLICCDGCEEWYHPPCARLARADLPATEEDDFHCALCCHSDKGDAGPLLKLADDSSECWRRLLPNATRAVVANALKGAAQLADCRAQGTEAIAALRTVLEDCDAWAARCDARLHAEHFCRGGVFWQTPRTRLADAVKYQVREKSSLSLSLSL